jgi:hypothetical protein
MSKTVPPEACVTLRQVPTTLWGVEIVQVEPGTRVEHEGSVLTVNDETAVVRGHRIYVTPRCNEAMKILTEGTPK